MIYSPAKLDILMAPRSSRTTFSPIKALRHHRALPVKSGGTKLPYDIWLYITSFLDSKTVAKLYSVNRELFDIAMDELYREGCIGYLTSDPEMRACNWRKHWGPLTTPRMKHLLLQSGTPYREKPTGRLHQRAMKSIRFGFFKIYMEKNISKMSKVVPKMTSVTALSIWLDKVGDPGHYTSKKEILRKGWSVFGQNLRTLVLHTPLEDIPEIMQGSTIFPHLENFTISVILTFRTSDPTALLCQSILPLLNTHHTTLKALTIESWNETIDLTLFLSKMLDMPNLLDFQLLQIFDSPEDMNTTGLCQFLTTHRSQLRHLGLHFMEKSSELHPLEDWKIYTPAIMDVSKSPVTFYKHNIYRNTPPLQTLAHDVYSRFSEHIRHTHFPKLESLELGIPDLSCPYTDSTIPYLQRYLHSLSSLVIIPCRFTYERVASLLSETQASEIRLRKIHLYIVFLCPDLLLLLAEKLPNLEHIVLFCDQCSPYKDSQVRVESRTAEFCSIMKKTIFPDWKLYSMNIQWLQYQWPSDKERIEISKAIFTALPQVEFISGEARDKILAAKNREPEGKDKI